ncbi:PREDICTED: PQ-loop repeat-containing protein 3 [Condylura cristata]|uniref:PQ-loop repeat-containing protein 3 n=1 Tax=Condylura cristata TaxID=143302 RepID=UPI000643A268|nr:PREDICTED: PQ-loop repeat-containing protein 3 [Condylura cristata]
MAACGGLGRAGVILTVSGRALAFPESWGPLEKADSTRVTLEKQSLGAVWWPWTGVRKCRFVVFLRYQCYYEYPLLTYLEYPILIAQDIALLLCVFHFNGDVKGAAPYIVLFAASWFLLTLQKWIIDLAMHCCTIISAASKFAQLQCLWKTQDSGAVSALTWILASYTCATRIITTLMTTSDLTILTRFVIMLALNMWVTATVLRYRKAAVKAE